MRRRRDGFTLLELLLIVAIIALLLAMLMPAASAITKQVKLVACQNNLRRIHTVLMGYADRSDGWFPEFHPHFGNAIFHPARHGVPHSVVMKDVRLLKQLGATAEIMFCPLDPLYGEPTWGWKTWSTDQYTAAIGYTALINRKIPVPGGYQIAQFADGRPVPQTEQCPADTPLVADLLRYRHDGYGYGWYHNSGGDPYSSEGLYNSSCNTLFRGGHVTLTQWDALKAQGPALTLPDRGGDSWWFWLGRSGTGE